MPVNIVASNLNLLSLWVSLGWVFRTSCGHQSLKCFLRSLCCSAQFLRSGPSHRLTSRPFCLSLRDLGVPLFPSLSLKGTNPGTNPASFSSCVSFVIQKSPRWGKKQLHKRLLTVIPVYIFVFPRLQRLLWHDIHFLFDLLFSHCILRIFSALLLRPVVR